MALWIELLFTTVLTCLPHCLNVWLAAWWYSRPPVNVTLRALLLLPFALVQVPKPEASSQFAFSDSCYFGGFWWCIQVANEGGNTSIFVVPSIDMAYSLVAADDAPDCVHRSIEVSAVECVPKGGVRWQQP